MKKLTLICLAGIFTCGSLVAETVAVEPESPSEEAASAEEALAAVEKDGEEANGWKSLPHGVRYRVVHEGDGTEASLWASVYLHYRITAENGVILEDTYTDPDHRGRAHKHVIGSGTMAEALEMVVMTMREMDRRVFEFPAENFSLGDFHSHQEGEEHDAEEHNLFLEALSPGSTVTAEVSLLWVRPYDPANYNRFRVPGN